MVINDVSLIELLSPLIFSWILTRIFRSYFHPRFSEPFLVTGDPEMRGDKEAGVLDVIAHDSEEFNLKAQDREKERKVENIPEVEGDSTQDANLPSLELLTIDVEKDDTEIEESKVEATVTDLNDSYTQDQIGLTTNQKRNPYFVLGYAASTHYKQKYAFFKLASFGVYTFGLFVCVPIILSRNNIFDEVDFSIAFKAPCTGIATLYFVELL